jgi:hypothetical protein
VDIFVDPEDKLRVPDDVLALTEGDADDKEELV